MTKLITSILLALTLNVMACECIPEADSAVVDSSGTTLTVTFNKPMTLQGKGDGWLNRFDATYAIAYNSGDGTDTWTFDITGPVVSTDVLTLEINNSPTDALGYSLLASFDPIENDSTQ